MIVQYFCMPAWIGGFYCLIWLLDKNSKRLRTIIINLLIIINTREIDDKVKELRKVELGSGTAGMNSSY
jgi:hypothetical protein